MTTNIKFFFRYIFIIVLLSVFSSTHAADKSQEVITVTIPKFGSELVSTWIKKYTETHPEVQIRVVEGNKGQVDLEFVSETQDSDNERFITYVGRYALLPVTTTENPLYEKLSRKRLDERGLKDLFFQKNVLQKAGNDRKETFPYEELTVYSAIGRVSGANAFASYFGYQASQFRGKRIVGDDLYLLTAINKDHTGITFNNLAYIFDLQNRRLKPRLCLIPLDIKKEQRDVLDNGNLDETLQLLENNDVALIPLSKVGFTYSDKASVADFLRWIVNEGQQYNHRFGFLTLDEKSVRKEQKQLEGNLLTDR